MPCLKLLVKVGRRSRFISVTCGGSVVWRISISGENNQPRWFNELENLIVESGRMLKYRETYYRFQIPVATLYRIAQQLAIEYNDVRLVKLAKLLEQLLKPTSAP